MSYQTIYQTTATNTGGRSGVSYIQGEDYQVTVASPGSQSQATNPEQLFALGYSACFNGALEAVLSSENIKAKSLVSLTTSLLKQGNDLDFKLAVTIAVAVDGQSLENTQVLAEKAHAVCPYSKAIAGNIAVEVTAVDYDSSQER